MNAVRTSLATVLACATWPASAAPPREVASEQVLEVVLALAGIIALILAAAWLGRRLVRLPGQAGSPFKLLGSMAIGSRERLLLVQIGDQQVLLATAPGQIRCLQTLARPVEVDAPVAERRDDGATAQRLPSAAGVGRT